MIAYSPTERLHTLNSPINGRIKKWYVDEGMKVKPGDLLVEINDNDPGLLKRLELEKKAIALRIEAAEQSIVAGKANLERQKGYISKELIQNVNLNWHKLNIPNTKVS